MSVIHRIGKRLDLWGERLFEWLGLISDFVESPAPDPLLADALKPYASKPDPIGSIFEKLRERDGCPHWHAEGVDDAPVGDPAKVFRCRDCGLTYREKVDPKKPWLVVDYAPVQVVS